MRHISVDHVTYVARMDPCKELIDILWIPNHLKMFLGKGDRLHLTISIACTLIAVLCLSVSTIEAIFGKVVRLLCDSIHCTTQMSRAVHVVKL